MTQQLLVICAVEAESEAVRAGLSGLDDVAVEVRTAAVGASAAAAVTATALAEGSYDAVLSMGVAGAFAGTGLPIGGAVVADRIEHADLGVQTAAEFLPITTLGLGRANNPTVPTAGVVTALAAKIAAAGIDTQTGTVLTLSCFTGTDARALALYDRHGALAEAMEGAGVATACWFHSVPVFEIRTISNLVGARDTSGWDLPVALQALTSVARAALTSRLPL